MTTAAASRLQFLITAGPEDPARALLGLNAALLAAGAGVEVAVFFTLRGTHWSCAAADPSEAGRRVAAAIEGLASTGASLECCAGCLEEHCRKSADELGDALRPEVRLAGLMASIQRASEGVATMTF